MDELFLRVLNISISASYVVLAVVVLRLLLKKAPRWVGPVLWAAVALRLVFPISIESVLSLLPSPQPIPTDIAYVQHPAIDSGIPVINQVVNPVIAENFTPDPVTSANPLQIWLEIGGWLWLAGMALMLLYTAFTYLRLRRRVSTAVPLWGNVYQCETVSSPFVLGLFRPRIYLPFHLGGQEMSYIVAHEQAHIQRRDHWWKPVGFTLLAVHWFNPLLWLAYILLCRDIELACDERVVRDLDRQGRADYSQALLTCSVSRRSIAACPLAFGEVGVKDRVKSVLNYKKPGFWIMALAVVSCVVLAVCFLTNPKEEEAPPTIRPGNYRTEEVLYSHGQEPENEDYSCKIMEDGTLWLKSLQEAESEWVSPGILEPADFTNENLEDLTRIRQNWISGYRANLGQITDVRFAVQEDGDETYLVFCTEDDECYLAVESVVGYDRLPYISYLARLAVSEPLEEPVVEDASMWGISLSVEKVSPTAATVLFTGGDPDLVERELLCSNDYCLQRYEAGGWVDVPAYAEPRWIPPANPIFNNRRHFISWEWLYGQLPDGKYRIGKQVWLRSDKAEGGSAMAWGEFTLGNPAEGTWNVSLILENVTPTGALVDFWQFHGDMAEGMTTENAYVLQSWDGGKWQDLPTRQEPAFGTGTIALANDEQSASVDWEPLYGALPDGRYRIAKEIWLRGREEEKHTLYSEFTLSLSGKKKPCLTIDDLVRLAEENRSLTFADFEDCPYVDIWDEGCPEFMDMSRVFRTDGDLRFVIRYAREGGKIYHMGLDCPAEGCDDYGMLDREGGLSDTFRFFINLHNRPLPPGQASHWGVSMGAENITPTGADLRFSVTTPEDTQFKAGSLIWLDRRNELGLWEEMPVLDGTTWEDEEYSEEYLRDGTVNWEKRYGVLPEGEYRLRKRLDADFIWVEEWNSYKASQSLTLSTEFTLGRPHAWLGDYRVEPILGAEPLGPFSCRVNFESWFLRGIENGTGQIVSWESLGRLESHGLTGAALNQMMPPISNWRFDPNEKITDAYAVVTHSGEEAYLLFRTESDGRLLAKCLTVGGSKKITALARMEHETTREMADEVNQAMDVELSIATGTPTGLALSLSRVNTPADMEVMAENGYTIQQKTESGWQDLKKSVSGEGVRVWNTVLQNINWEEPLPDGTYRLGKNVSFSQAPGKLEQKMCYAEFRVHNRERLTSADVLRLSQKKDKLTWADFEDFDYLEVLDASRPAGVSFRRLYDLEGPLELSVNGEGADKAPANVSLCCKTGTHSEIIDIMSWDSVVEFIQLHDVELGKGQLNHYGVTLEVQNAGPTGAQLIFEADPPSGAALLGGSQYALERRSEEGRWEEVPTLKAASWERDEFSKDSIRSQTIDWEDRYGALPGGHYRLKKNVSGPGFQRAFYAEFAIVQTQASDWGVTMTAEGYEGMGMVLKLHREGHVSPQPLYWNGGYRFEAWDGEFWQMMSQVSSRWGSSAVKVDFDDPNGGRIVENEALGNLKNGLYRFVVEVAPGTDGVGSFQVAAEFTVDTGKAPFGYTPLEKLPRDYTRLQAAEDGCIVMTDGTGGSGQGLFTQFWSRTFEKKQAFLRFVSCYTNNRGAVDRLYVHDLNFDGEKYILRWMENGRVQEKTYQYLKHFEQGFPTDPDRPYVYSWDVLTNDKDLRMPDYAPEEDNTACGVVNEHEIVFSAKTFQYGPQLHGSIYQARLELDGKKQTVITDAGELWKLHWLLSNAEDMDPGTEFNDAGLDLRLTLDDGTELIAELDTDRAVFRTGGEIHSYEAIGGFGIMWEYLGIDKWPVE